MSNNKYKILVVEDDRSIAGMIQTVLETGGYQVLVAGRCEQGVLMLRSHMPDLVVLDLGLPDMDGSEFIRIARRDRTVPIIVLSARMEEADKIAALDLGANDYITKPFSTGELLARIRASLRIVHGHQQTSGGTFTLGGLTIEHDRRQVRVDGEPVHLTRTEFNILAFLSRHPGKVMTYAAIVTAIWGGLDDGSVKKLQVNMANIRRKLGCAPGDDRYIVNELGVGYRMSDPQN
ncbi:MAG: response regulator transcription factor [Oscillospiraceae bacterium]|nr:response regulator transcription factor [Oscillospiraceae bacterium]MBQ2383460.1 response regulator transcription factor [Oscillospiraceae bacterium]MBQ5712254.1 response regulator transcription factor [Oscillospiraceae bacterium]